MRVETSRTLSQGTSFCEGRKETSLILADCPPTRTTPDTYDVLYGVMALRVWYGNRRQLAAQVYVSGCEGRLHGIHRKHRRHSSPGERDDTMVQTILRAEKLAQWRGLYF